MKTRYYFPLQSGGGLAAWAGNSVVPGAIAGLMLVAGHGVASPPGPIPFGVYDPEGSFSADTGVSIEHVFLPWEGVDLETLRIADAYAQERNRSMLVTIEPWIWGAPYTVETLRSAILAGRHDATMRSVCRVLGTLKSSVTVRWAQEMDNPNGHFPWALWRPEDHIQAYRRMVTVCRSVAPDLEFMWSPAGEAGLQAYYPGDDVVDVIGLSVFGVEEYERARFGSAKSFSEILGPRYDRAAVFGKPIIVAELGFTGGPEYLDDWFYSIRQVDDLFPDLAAVIYFNREEVWPWPDDFGLPDWRNSAQR
ncbi:glycoside hydrolase family 26 protein [Roseinatronobacter sp.]|uniref:glycoside hydrolase family 26 protein n=1 Tax=Roseinatronobacter sp. TaxID=1945755 RepID=UPI003F726652